MSKVIRVPFAPDLKELNGGGSVSASNAFLEYMMRGGKIAGNYCNDDIVKVDIVGELIEVDINDNSAVCLFYDNNFAENVIKYRWILGYSNWIQQSRIIMVSVGNYREEVNRKAYKDCYADLGV